MKDLEKENKRLREQVKHLSEELDKAHWEIGELKDRDRKHDLHFKCERSRICERCGISWPCPTAKDGFQMEIPNVDFRKYTKKDTPFNFPGQTSRYKKG